MLKRREPPWNNEREINLAATVQLCLSGHRYPDTVQSCLSGPQLSRCSTTPHLSGPELSGYSKTSFIQTSIIHIQYNFIYPDLSYPDTVESHKQNYLMTGSGV